MGGVFISRSRKNTTVKEPAQPANPRSSGWSTGPLPMPSVQICLPLVSVSASHSLCSAAGAGAAPLSLFLALVRRTAVAPVRDAHSSETGRTREAGPPLTVRPLLLSCCGGFQRFRPGNSCVYQFAPQHGFSQRLVGFTDRWFRYPEAETQLELF